MNVHTADTLENKIRVMLPPLQGAHLDDIRELVNGAANPAIKIEMRYMELQTEHGIVGAEGNMSFEGANGERFNTQKTLDKLNHSRDIDLQRKLTLLALAIVMEDLCGAPPGFTSWVNVAPQLLCDPDFLNILDRKVVELQAKTGQKSVGFEITEDAPDRTIVDRREFRDGVRRMGKQHPTALDDVSGPGIFTAEKAIELHDDGVDFKKYKLDRSVLENPDKLHRIVGLLIAHDPEIILTLEGVEKEKLPLIQQLQAKYPHVKFEFQGYAFGKPETAQNFLQRVNQKGKSQLSELRAGYHGATIPAGC